MRVVNIEFACTFIEDFNDSGGALIAGQGSEKRRFNTCPCGFVEVFESFGLNLSSAESSGFGSFVGLGENTLAQFTRQRESLADFTPAHLANEFPAIIVAVS